MTVSPKTRPGLCRPSRPRAVHRTSLPLNSRQISACFNAAPKLNHEDFPSRHWELTTLAVTARFCCLTLADNVHARNSPKCPIGFTYAAQFLVSPLRLPPPPGLIPPSGPSEP